MDKQQTLSNWVQNGCAGCALWMVDAINRDLDSIRDWVERFGLVMNFAKCQAIIVGSQRLLNKLDSSVIPPVTQNRPVIDFRPTVKNLALLMDSTLS